MRHTIRLSVILAMTCLLPAMTEAACGTRGGPGYRGPDGKCVGWANLRKVCGSPPSTNCTPEIVAEGAEAVAGPHGSVTAVSGAATAVGLLSTTTTASATISGPIEGQASVIDGDTIKIYGERFRLSEIDALESDQLCRCGLLSSASIEGRERLHGL